MVAERRTTAPCGKTITVRVSSWTEGRAFAAPREAAEYREACTTTGISMPTASLRRVEAALAGVTSCVVGAIVVPPARRDKGHTPTGPAVGPLSRLPTNGRYSTEVLKGPRAANRIPSR